MWIDIMLIIMIGAGVLYGYNKGLIQTIFSIFGIFIGIIAILKIAPFIINLLGGVLGLDPSLTFIIGMAVSCILVLVTLKFIGKMLNKATRTAVISTVNKGLGAIVLAVFFAIAFSFIIWFLDKGGLVSEAVKEKSVTYHYLETLPDTAKGIAKALQPIFADLINEAKEAFTDFKETESR